MKSRHVIHNLKGGWSVLKSGAERASRTFADQEEAISYARTLARKEHAELFVHRRDGTIREKSTYDRGSPLLKERG